MPENFKFTEQEITIVINGLKRLTRGLPWVCAEREEIYRLRDKFLSMREVIPATSRELGYFSSLSNRTINPLRRAGIITVNDVLNYNERQLLKIPNFGNKSLKELKDFLAAAELYLKE